MLDFFPWEHRSAHLPYLHAESCQRYSNAKGHCFAEKWWQLRAEVYLMPLFHLGIAWGETYAFSFFYYDFSGEVNSAELLPWIKYMATRGVTVSMSAFLACHQCYCAGSRLGLESSGCSMWHFLKLVARGFLRVLRFPPLLHRFNGSANKIKLI